MKYVIILCALLAGYACWQRFSLQKSEEKNQQLRLQNSLLQQKQDNLIKKMGEFNAKQEKANLQIVKLKALALQQKDDCYARAMPDDYLEFVRGTNKNGK